MPPSDRIARRPLIAVIGESEAAADDAAYRHARTLGEKLIDAGYRVCCGGLTGVMTAALQGARESAAYRDGDTVAIIPTLDHRQANRYADIVIATGLGHSRNGIVAAAEAVVVVGGKAGTLSELAFAWCYNRLIIALTASGGVAAEFAGRSLDGRNHRKIHPALTVIAAADTAEQAVNHLNQNLPQCYFPINDWNA